MINHQCMNCGSERLEEFLDLGRQPNGNNFPTAELASEEPVFPMSMLVCQECWQVQIREFPSPEFLFSDHPYVTGLNVPVVRHFEALAQHVVEKLRLSPNSLVLDIGCNDGTFLRSFAVAGMRTLGVDPGLRTGELAKSQGTTVCRTFWNREAGAALRQLGVFPDVITATAVFYHVPDLHDFILGLKEVMSPDSVFVVQGVYLKDLIEKNEFDHFYHEHSCIHAIGPLRRLFGEHGMRLLDVEFSSIHGGSFVLYVARDESPLPTSESIEKAIRAEEEAGLFEIGTYHGFAQRVRDNTDELVRLLHELKADGKRVMAVGAPVKGSTLLNFCQIGPDLVECATEVNPFKIGRLTPGTHIPIVDERTLDEAPDYYLLLAWNFLEYFVEKYHSYLENGGQFIVPVPGVRTISIHDLATPSQVAPV